MATSPLDATHIVDACHLRTCQCGGYFQSVVLASSKIVRICFLLPCKVALVRGGTEIFWFGSQKLSINFVSLFRRESSWVDAIWVWEEGLLFWVDFHILPAVSLPAAGHQMHLLTLTIEQVIGYFSLIKNAPHNWFALTWALVLILGVILSFGSSRVCW